MMNSLLLIGKIVYYLLFVFCLYFYAKSKYKKDKNRKFGIAALVIFAILFGIYGVICGPPGESIGDRHNYAVRFETPGQENFVGEGSFGLFLVESAIQVFTRDSAILFFIISVIYFCINIYCYKKTEETTPFYLLLFFLSTIGLYGFFALKQALSIAFVNLALTKYFQDKKKLAVVFLIISIMFHEAAWIVIPCFIIARYMGKSNIKRAILYSSVLVIAVFFPQISKYFVDLFNHIPGMSAQIDPYLDESGSVLVDTNFFTVFKSAPYYLVTFIAMVFRNNFKDKINNYDFLLVFSVLCSVFSLLSLHMYWMFRFAAYCYAPCFILVSQIAIKLRDKNVKYFKLIIVGTMLVLMIKLLVQYYFIYGGIV